MTPEQKRRKNILHGFPLNTLFVLIDLQEREIKKIEIAKK
jgi:hypothetical protein